MWGITPEEGKTKGARPSVLELRWNAAGVAATDPYSVLVALKLLLDQGALTQAEYDKKKDEMVAKFADVPTAIAVPVALSPVRAADVPMALAVEVNNNSKATA
jgi:hypothetical protein